MAPDPAVSVLMPVFNGRAFLAQAIESIQHQTYSDWELVIVDDGSSDDSPSIASGFAARDPRIRVHLAQHQGLVGALNTGVSLCRGRYILRMDSDDVSFPSRFERQVGYLDANAHTNVVGCGTSSLPLGLGLALLPRTPLECRWQMAFRNCVGHPGVAIRASCLPPNPYREEYFLAEDFKLWCDLLRSGDAFVLPTRLLVYRKHPGSLSSRNAARQAAVNRRIVSENLRETLHVDVSHCISASPDVWAAEVLTNVLAACARRRFNHVERAPVLRALSIYLSLFGPLVYMKYIRRSGIRQTISHPVLTALNLARAFIHARSHPA